VAEVPVEERRDLGHRLLRLGHVGVRVELGVGLPLVDVKLGLDPGAAELAVSTSIAF
jgi:hypothetical protein